MLADLSKPAALYFQNIKTCRMKLDNNKILVTSVERGIALVLTDRFVK